MVYNVGIGQFRKTFVTYNKITTEFDQYKVDGAIASSNQITFINAIFKTIKQKVRGKLGCLCVESKVEDNNEIRKAFIEGGKQCGFKKVQIVDEKTLLYSDYVRLTGYTPNNGDIIWVFRPWECFIWEKTDSKVKMVENFSIPRGSKFEIFQKIKDDSGFEKSPNIIVYDNKFQKKIDLCSVNTIFPKCICKPVTPNESPEEGDAALIKALIMAEDPILSNYDTEIQLGSELKIEIDGKELIFLDEFEQLPFEKTVMLNPEIQGKTLKAIAIFTKRDTLDDPSKVVIYEEEIKLTQEMMKLKEVSFIFKIDVNKICSAHYSLPPRKHLQFLIKRGLPQYSQIEQQPPFKKVSKGSQTEVAKNISNQKSSEVITLDSDSDLEHEIETLQIDNTPHPKLTYRSPSNSWMQKACEKFGLEYSQIIPNIEITDILPSSKPNQCKFVTKGPEAGFRALSFFLSVKENGVQIKTAIICYYLDNHKESNKMQDPNFSILLNATDMMPIHWEIVSKILECRIGIYETDGLKKYGDWSKDDNGTLTFLFKRDGENDYGIVLSLI